LSACDGFGRRVGLDCESLRLKRGRVETPQAIVGSVILTGVYDQGVRNGFMAPALFFRGPILIRDLILVQHQYNNYNNPLHEGGPQYVGLTLV
jgi:hypothetical protein